MQSRDISKERGCLALLSGGLDSLVAVAMTRLFHPIRRAITFSYGQRACSQEISAARAIAEFYKITHEVIELPWFEGMNSALTSSELEIPQLQPSDLMNRKLTEKTASKVWVPNRNGVFLSIASSLAENMGAHRVIVGFNEEEAGTFPDNSLEFLQSFNESLVYSTGSRVKAIAPTIGMNKAEIYSQGRLLHAPLHLVWSCYRGEEKPCGTCESCVRFEQARVSYESKLPGSQAFYA